MTEPTVTIPAAQHAALMEVARVLVWIGETARTLCAAEPELSAINNETVRVLAALKAAGLEL